MSVLFYGDAHGRFGPLLDAVRRNRSRHVVLVGDLELDQPLTDKLAGVLETGARVHWIHGNHDARTPAMHDNLFGSPGGFHARAARLDHVGGTVTIAGLGGHYKGKVWFPREGSEAAAYADRTAFLRNGIKAGLFRDGLPLDHRQTIFPEDHAALAALRGVDVLVTHEAPTAAGRKVGFGAIDDLARDMGVRLVVHGHHHRSYAGATRDGIPVRGLDRAEAWMLALPP